MKKFILYSMEQVGFIGQNNSIHKSMDSACILTHGECQESGIAPHDTSKYIYIPMTQDFINELPFDLYDKADNQVNTTTVPSSALFVNTNPSLDVVLLTPYGFIGERFNETYGSMSEQRGFDLTEATLYNKQSIKDSKQKEILNGSIAISVNTEQRVKLQTIKTFTETTFFDTPIGMIKKPKTTFDTGVEPERVDHKDFFKYLNK